MLSELTGQFGTVLTIVFGAAVGSGFYSLATAQRYIRNRTFNPQFNQVYVIRYVVGIVAGTIIGMFAWQGGQFEDLGGPAVIAIIGGYSAEVVQQILTRLAEAMLTIVKGSPADQKDLAVAQAKADAEQKKARDKVEMTKLLSDIKGEVAKGGSGNEAIDSAVKKIDEAIDSI